MHSPTWSWQTPPFRQSGQSFLQDGPHFFAGQAAERAEGAQGRTRPGASVWLPVPASWGAGSPLTSHDQAVEGAPQRAVPHERGTVDPIFAHADVGECQGDKVAPHLAPVRGLVVGACKGAEGDLGPPVPPGTGTSTGWEQPRPRACSQDHLPFLFHITSVSFLLRTLAEKVAGSATFTDCVAFTGKRWAAREEDEEDEQAEQQSPPRALTPKGSAGTPRPTTPKRSPGAAQHPPHMFLLGCHDVPPPLPHLGVGTPPASIGTDTQERAGAPCPLASPAQDAGGSSLGRWQLGQICMVPPRLLPARGGAEQLPAASVGAGEGQRGEAGVRRAARQPTGPAALSRLFSSSPGCWGVQQQ